MAGRLCVEKAWHALGSGLSSRPARRSALTSNKSWGLGGNVGGGQATHRQHAPHTKQFFLGRS
jgi:hypothetical protein